MKTFGLAVLITIGGYLAGVVLGMVGVHLLSGNRQDKSLEAAMTSFFFYGPAVAILALIVFLAVRFTR